MCLKHLITVQSPCSARSSSLVTLALARLRQLLCNVQLVVPFDMLYLVSGTSFLFHSENLVQPPILFFLLPPLLFLLLNLLSPHL